MKMVVIILMMVGLWSFAPLANSNAYLHSTTYDTVQVKYGDTVWSIAAKRASEKDDVRNLIQAIREANQLNANVQIYPGDVLKVPVKISAN